MAYFGRSEAALTSKVTGTSKTYGIADLCGAPATTDGWVEPGTLHSALMTGLKPGTRYFYKYGQVHIVGWLNIVGASIYLLRYP